MVIAILAIIIPLCVTSHAGDSRENVCFGNRLIPPGYRGRNSTILRQTYQEGSSIMGRLSYYSGVGKIAFCSCLGRGTYETLLSNRRRLSLRQFACSLVSLFNEVHVIHVLICNNV